MRYLKSILLTTMLSLSLLSCDFLEVNPETVLLDKNFWKTEDDARAAVNAIYAPLQSTYSKYAMFWFEARSDNWYSSVGTNDARSTQEIALNNISSAMLPTDWNDFYSAISKANYAIHFLPKMDNITEVSKNHLLAESYFLRAKCYFDIVRIWGDAPLITVPVLSLQDVTYPSRDSKETLLNAIENDIIKSIELADKAKNDKFLFSYSAALVLASHYYMWVHDYEKVDEYTNEIMKLNLFKLVPSADWAKMLNSGNMDENIWSLKFSYANNGTNSYMVYMCGRSPSLLISEPLRERWQNLTTVNEDARFEKTTTAYARAPYPFNHLQTPYAGSGIYKFSLQQYVPTIGNEIPIALFRYAEVLLLRAEALANLEKFGEAIQLLNQVHSRSVLNRVYKLEDFSGHADVKAALIDAILNERQIELLGEGYRWFDLVRTGKYVSVMNNFYENYIAAKSNLKFNLYKDNDSHVYLPIYKLNLNDNSNLVQTDGY